jgi:hypothetical protein
MFFEKDIYFVTQRKVQTAQSVKLLLRQAGKRGKNVGWAILSREALKH